MERAREWGVKNKKEIILAILIFFVSTIGFGLGFLTAQESSITPIVIEQCSEISQLK
jgi:hypothetical protein